MLGLEFVIVMIFVSALIAVMIGIPMVIVTRRMNQEERSHDAGKRDSSKNKTGVAPFDAGIRELIREGKKAEALQAYQTFTHLSEADAQIEIERLEWEESQSRENSD